MYIAKQNGLIVQFNDNLELLKLATKYMPDVTYEETDKEYKMYYGQICTVEKCAELEEDFINHLTMTALDIISIIKSLGVSDEIILQFLKNNPSIQLQLTLCKDVYCGVVRQLCPLKITETLTLTDDMVVQFFKKKHNIE